MIFAMRLLLSFVWGYCVAALLNPGAMPYAVLAGVIFRTLLFVHAVECMFVYRKLKQMGGPVASNLAQVMLFGMFHYLPLKAEFEAKRG